MERKQLIKNFRKKIWSFYKKHGRHDMAWRATRNPYHILVSEIMLQQTQVDRVVKKYPEFIRTFPTIQSLAEAPLTKVVRAWQGMGYNRRALYIWQSAQRIARDHKGKVPRAPETLETLAGIGTATARSIACFAYNAPVAFIETNIRSVFIHEFYASHRTVHDKKILPLVEQALDKKNPREWHYALMDYGTALKKETKNPSRRSAHHVKQKKFAGSDREIRGNIIRALLNAPHTFDGLLRATHASRERVRYNLKNLAQEGLIKKHNHIFEIESSPAK